MADASLSLASLADIMATFLPGRAAEPSAASLDGAMGPDASAPDAVKPTFSRHPHVCLSWSVAACMRLIPPMIGSRNGSARLLQAQGDSSAAELQIDIQMSHISAFHCSVPIC